MQVDQAELNSERATLRQARRDITEGEQRVRKQAGIAARMRADGHDSAGAERLLATFRATLAGWKTHEDLILQRIAYLEGKERDAAGLGGKRLGGKRLGGKQ
jgi:hypothetical protein